MVKTVQLHLPLTLEDCGGMKRVYLDQAPYHVQYEDRHISAVYTPEGISRIDQEFCTRIQNSRTKKQRDKIKQEILFNEHLHPVIKQNLIYNLENI